MASVPSASTYKTNFVETSLATITEHVQVQNTAAPIMYTVPVSNIASNKQQSEITKIATERFSATPTLQETLNKMISRMTKMENNLYQMQANVPVPNLQYFQLSNLSSNPAVPPAADTIRNSSHFEQDQISLHPRELLSEDVGDFDNQENFDSPTCHVVTELNGNRDRQQKISELFDQSLVSSSHQNNERATIEDNVSEDGNLQLHEEIIDTIIGERQSKQNSGPGIVIKLAVGIKKFWTEDSEKNSLFKQYKDQLAVPENCEYIIVPLLNDDTLKNKNIHYYYKRNNKKICRYAAASLTSLYCCNKYSK